MVNVTYFTLTSLTITSNFTFVLILRLKLRSHSLTSLSHFKLYSSLTQSLSCSRLNFVLGLTLCLTSPSPSYHRFSISFIYPHPHIATFLSFPPLFPLGPHLHDYTVRRRVCEIKMSEPSHLVRKFACDVDSMSNRTVHR